MRKTKNVDSAMIAYFLVIALFIIMFMVYLRQTSTTAEKCDDKCMESLYQSGYVAGASRAEQALQNKQETVRSNAPIESGIEHNKDALRLTDAKIRDLQVLRDPLYPPINRTDTATFSSTKTMIDKREMYVRTQQNDDQFRLVGYLTCVDANADDKRDGAWKLFARQVNSNRAEFYMSSTNSNYDVKIPITDDVLSNGYKLRSVYDIPSELRFKTPLLSSCLYRFVELPKASLDAAGTYI